MSPQDHNKLLGVLHLAYGGLHALMLIIISIIMLFMWGVSGAPSFALLFIALGLFISALFLLPPFLAGYGLLKRKRWAKIFAMISAVLAAINFPHGTALCVYTFWFLTGDMGKAVYEGKGVRASLQDAPPPPTPFWSERDQSSRREREYVPPPQPPDWR